MSDELNRLSSGQDGLPGRGMVPYRRGRNAANRVSLEWFVSSYSPAHPEQNRLLHLLRAYRRDALWLRVVRVHALTTQLPQAVFDVVDADGLVIADASGRKRTHTLQLYSPTLRLVTGQWVHLVRRGPSVLVWVQPMALGQVSPGPTAKC